MEEDQTCRILIIEDSPDDADLLRERIAGFLPAAETACVDSEPALREILARGRWDLVVSDHAMPSFDSARALQVLREAGLDVPFIICTGHLDERGGASAMRIGAQDWIDKNDLSRLEPVVMRELRAARVRRDKERAETSALQLSKYDSLTRLPNRSLFSDLVQLRLTEPGAATGTAAVLLIDLDRFSRVNDAVGYAAGDGIIRQVAARLRAVLPAGAVLSRLGQDEFAIFFVSQSGARGPEALAERLSRRFSEPLVSSGQDFYLTLSVGVSLYPQHGKDPATLLGNAESAMHVAKRLGGNDCRVFQTELHAASNERLRIETELRHAIQRRQLSLVYQPVFDISSGSLVGAEALLRWRHPELGMVSPDRFIPVADETGLIHEIGEWTLAEACAEALHWGEHGHASLSVAVNFSATQFRNPSFAERVRRVVARSGLAPQRLVMEITEGAAMQDAENTVEILNQLKLTGIRVAIDDFGTGYSSLSYLKRFPIDVLKIDRAFMRDVPTDAENTALAHTIIALGHAMRLKIIAEGVESAPQLAFLRAEKCDRAQGYLLSKPLAPEHFLELLSRDGGRVTALQPALVAADAGPLAAQAAAV